MNDQAQYVELSVGIQYSSKNGINLVAIERLIEKKLQTVLETAKQEGLLACEAIKANWVAVQVNRIDDPETVEAPKTSFVLYHVLSDNSLAVFSKTDPIKPVNWKGGGKLNGAEIELGWDDSGQPIYLRTESTKSLDGMSL